MREAACQVAGVKQKGTEHQKGEGWLSNRESRLQEAMHRVYWQRQSQMTCSSVAGMIRSVFLVSACASPILAINQPGRKLAAG